MKNSIIALCKQKRRCFRSSATCEFVLLKRQMEYCRRTIVAIDGRRGCRARASPLPCSHSNLFPRTSARFDRTLKPNSQSHRPSLAPSLTLHGLVLHRCDVFETNGRDIPVFVLASWLLLALILFLRTVSWRRRAAVLGPAALVRRSATLAVALT